jgi:hypothetical protein
VPAIGKCPRKITRSKQCKTPLILWPCLAIKDFTALLLPAVAQKSLQVGQRRYTPFIGCGEAAVGVCGVRDKPAGAGAFLDSGEPVAVVPSEEGDLVIGNP